MAIKRIREAEGMSQKELASALDVSPATVCMWEKRKNFPSVKQLIKMALLFGCTLDDLIPLTEYAEGGVADEG